MTPTKRRPRAPSGKGSNYNVLAAVQGTVGAPPLTKLLATHGQTVQSVVLRVDAEFARYVRVRAQQTQRTVTSTTRDILLTLTGGTP